MLFLLFFLALGGSGYLAASPVARQSPSARSQQHKHASPRSTAHRLRSFTQPGLHSPERPRPGLVRVIAAALAPQRPEQRGMEPNHSRRKRGGRGRPGNNSNLGGGWDGGRGKLWGKWSSSSGCGSPPLTSLPPASGQSPPAVGSPSPATQASPEGWVLGDQPLTSLQAVLLYQVKRAVSGRHLLNAWCSAGQRTGTGILLAMGICAYIVLKSIWQGKARCCW